jgi:nicotinate-nucleotide adenylyltransferase
VLRRSGNPVQKVKSELSQKVIYLDSPLIDLSATEIRKKIKMGIDVSELIPPSVLKIINDYGLYRD